MSGFLLLVKTPGLQPSLQDLAPGDHDGIYVLPKIKNYKLYLSLFGKLDCCRTIFTLLYIIISTWTL